jgi:hypothetical protein
VRSWIAKSSMLLDKYVRRREDMDLRQGNVSSGWVASSGGGLLKGKHHREGTLRGQRRKRDCIGYRRQPPM